jgi:alkanesulfonate monooxygenase SsuD/methylene tetrahydromethanopterin reductase-like flavin-dependent oxidoreductase (luciferase family)
LVRKGLHHHGYDFGTFGSRFDLFDESLIRIENRFAALIPPPVRKLPILIGGTGPRRSLPAVARHANIWHAFQDLDAFRRSIDRVDELTATFGRDGADIERSTLWENARSADAFREVGVTLFQTELASDNGYDLRSLKEVVTWRDHG